MKLRLKKSKPLAIFSVSSMLYSAIQMLFGLVVLRWVGPEDMGLWNTVGIISPYIAFLQLGIFVALNRELPFLLGKGEKNQAMNAVITAANHANRVSLLLLFFTVLVLLYFYVKDYNSLYLLVIAVFGSSVVFQVKQNMLVVTYRSANDFQKLGYIYLAIIPVYLISILLVAQYNFYGFLICQVLVPAVLYLLLYYFRPYKVGAKFIKSSFRELLKTGLPFFSISYIGGIATTFKKILIVKYLGVSFLGLFSPALAVLAVGRVMPKILGQFVYPKMSRQFGSSNDTKAVWQINIRAILFVMLLSIPFISVLYFILPYLFDWVFIEYKEAYVPTKIVLLSIIFFAPQMAYNSLMSVKAYKAMLFINITKLAIYWFVIIFCYKSIGGLQGIAWGIVASDVLFSLILLAVCYYELVLKKVVSK